MSDSKTLEALQQKYRYYRLSALLMLLILITALILVFVNPILTLVAMGIAVIYHLFVFRRQQKSYSAAVTAANLTQTVCAQLHAAAPTERGKAVITNAAIKAANLMPFKEVKNSPLFCWNIVGENENIPISLCDATFAQDFQLVKKGRKRVHFNSGVWVHMELPKDTGADWRLLDEVSVPTPIRMDYYEKQKKMETAPVGNAAIGKRFVLYRPVDDSTQTPSPAVLHQVKLLMDYTPGYAAISLRGNQLDVFLRGRFLARPVSMAKKPDKALLEFHPLPELSYLIHLAKAAMQ